MSGFPPRSAGLVTLAALLAIAVAGPASAAAQVPELPPPEPAVAGRRFTVSVGPGVTATLNRLPDWSATLTLALGYALDDRWTISVAPYWERETDHLAAGSITYDEISLALGASLALDDRWSVGMEVDVGVLQNPSGPWEGNPEIGIGVGVSWAIPLARDWNLVMGPELAWKITDGGISLGLNTGVTFDF